MAKPFEQLQAVAREMSFVQGAELVRQGEASRGAFLIRRGAVEARVALPGGGALTVARFADGDMFGEMSLIERGVCSATVVALGKVDAWFVGRDEFRALVASRELAGPGELVGFMAVINAAPRANHARVREACCLLELPREAFLAIYNGSSAATVSLHHAIHRSLMRSIARTNTQLTRLISHARLAAAAERAVSLEAALHGQIWRAAAGPPW